MTSRNKASKEQHEGARSFEKCCCDPQKGLAMMAKCCEEVDWDCESMMQAMKKMCAGQKEQGETEKPTERPA